MPKTTTASVESSLLILKLHSVTLMKVPKYKYYSRRAHGWCQMCKGTPRNDVNETRILTDQIKLNLFQNI